MLTDDGDGMIGVLAVNGVVGVTAAAGIGSLIDDFDGICTSFNINSFTSLLLLDRRGNEENEEKWKQFFKCIHPVQVRMRFGLTLKHNLH